MVKVPTWGGEGSLASMVAQVTPELWQCCRIPGTCEIFRDKLHSTYVI